MGPLLGLAEAELGATTHHLATVRQKDGQHVHEGELPGLPLHQSQVNHPESGLEGSPGIELAQGHLGSGVPLELQHDAQPLAVRLVPEV